MSEKCENAASVELPDFYETVAADVLDYVGHSDGVWLDIGSGGGGLGLAVAAKCTGPVVLLDPDIGALSNALAQAETRGLAGRIVAVVGNAERMPLHDGSVAFVVSRGSFWFWEDRVQGLRGIYRVMRVGGKAMVGGGLGSRYPEWARREFIRRRRGSTGAEDPEAARRFSEDRSPETFRRLAQEAGLPSFEVIGEGRLGPDDPKTGIGVWLRFVKEDESTT